MPGLTPALEQARRAHAEIEFIQHQLVEERLEERYTHRDRLAQQRRTRALLDTASDRARDLLALYAAPDTLRGTHAADAEGSTSLGAGRDGLVDFYRELEALRETFDLAPAAATAAAAAPDGDAPMAVDDDLGAALAAGTSATATATANTTTTAAAAPMLMNPERAARMNGDSTPLDAALAAHNEGDEPMLPALHQELQPAPFQQYTVRHVAEEHAALDAIYTGEERLGRNFDLNELYNAYINLPPVRATLVDDASSLSYIAFLRTVAHPTSHPLAVRQSLAFQKWILSLTLYLTDFVRRAFPLYDLPQLHAEAEAAFAARWGRDGDYAGWEALVAPSSTTPSSAVTETMAATTAATETETTNHDELYCIACQKQFSNPNTFRAHVPGKRHRKAVEALDAVKTDASSTAKKTLAHGDASHNTTTSPSDSSALTPDQCRAAAWNEFWVEHLFKAFSGVLEDTQIHTERKQTLTETELRLEQLRSLAPAGDPDAESVASDAEGDGDDRDDQPIYNPFNLPLGWDGKPIPFWLYKLHGLNVKYACEICGNMEYMGRRAFDAHFTKSRHLRGLKCLGITQPRLFQDITSIAAAYALQEKLDRERSAMTASNPDLVEEFEDHAGNVFNRKTYEDLKRQGLL